MPNSHQSPSSTSLPLPATSPGAHMPRSASATMGSTPFAVSEQTKRDIPWKYEGYKALSAWMASEDDFFIFRRFENLNAQTILWMQHRISQIEEKLEVIHKIVEGASMDEKLMNSSFVWDEQSMQNRHALMGELSSLLHHYNQYIEAFSKIRARPRATDRQLTNVRSWLSRGAIDNKEASFINHTRDLISINHRTRPPFGRFLESLTALHLIRPFRKRSRSKDPRYASPSTIYSSNTTFEYVSNMSIILAGLLMLLAPMWWLEFAESSITRLKIITGFVVCFVLVMLSAAINRPFEIVASSAAYAAVLMVFMQIDGKGSERT